MGGKSSGTKAKPKFKSYAEARKDREKFRKKLVRARRDAKTTKYHQRLNKYKKTSEMEAAPRYKLPVNCLQLTMLTRGGRGDRDYFPQKAK